MMNVPDFGLLRPRNVAVTIVVVFVLLVIAGWAGGWLKSEVPNDDAVQATSPDQSEKGGP